MDNFPVMQQQQQDKGRRMSQAALILGLASIATAVLMLVWPPYICGALAVLFAILSTGKRTGMDPRARAATRAAVFGMVMNTIIIAAVIYAFCTDENLRNAFYQNFETFYGMSFEEFIESLGSGAVQ